jgi:hypothetical protein
MCRFSCKIRLVSLLHLRRSGKSPELRETSALALWNICYFRSSLHSCVYPRSYSRSYSIASRLHTL